MKREDLIRDIRAAACESEDPEDGIKFASLKDSQVIQEMDKCSCCERRLLGDDLLFEIVEKADDFHDFGMLHALAVNLTQLETLN